MRRLFIATVVLALTLGAVPALGAEEPPATGTFSPAGWLDEGRLSHTATALADGRVLVVGGASADGGGVLLDSAELWDPATATFSPTGSLAVAREWHSATLLLDGRVLIVGGRSYDGTLRSAEVWDPVSGTFSPGGSLAEPRENHAAALLPDGRVLVAGGWNVEGASVTHASAEVWDPATGTFGPASPLSEARREASVTTLHDGRVFILGGDGASGFLASAEIWDPGTEAFESTGSLPEARMWHTATLLEDGRVVVIGGWDVISEGLLVAQVWDPATGEFGPSGRLAEPRHNHTATLLPDGRVLVAGGQWSSIEPPYATTEAWDPATGVFSPEAPLAEARWGHTPLCQNDVRHPLSINV